MTQPGPVGFTIIELLVVIALILLVSSLIFISGGGGDGAALPPHPIVSGVAKGARSQAILKNTNARLIIHNDPTEPEKYRRLLGIIYEDPEDDSASPVWIAAQGPFT